MSGFLWRLILVLTIGTNIVVNGFRLNNFKKNLRNELLEIRLIAEAYLSANNMVKSPSPDYPYWNFLPQYMTSVLPGQDTVWESTCFKENSAVLTKDGQTLSLQVTSRKAKDNLACVDHYAFGTVSAISLMTQVRASKTVVVTDVILTIPADVNDAELWDIDNKGVRVYSYVNDVQTTLSNLLVSIELLIPESLPTVPKKIEEMTIDFMSKYAHFDYTPRDTALNVIPDESEVKSGDAFYITRLDGSYSMMAWVMGATNGHVATAMWIDGALYVCESTTADAYWPTDGIQKTPYKQWMQQNIDARMLVIWAPLNEQMRKAYNESTASEFFRANEGLDYGFQTLLWGWLDTERNNYPCLPPDFSSNCFDWEFLEIFVSLADRKSPWLGDMLWNQGLNKRLGTSGLRTSELLQEAAKQGTTPTKVIAIPESDSWLYNTTRYEQPAEGRAMVCCVFVCSTWKYAGIFGELTDSIDCSELTNWDDYALDIHAESFRQIIGEYNMDLNNYRLKSPYAQMAHTCDSLPPDYARAIDC